MFLYTNIGQEKKIQKNLKKFKKKLKTLRFSMKSLTFSCLICALNHGATKPIFCSKVAQRGRAPGC